MYVYVILIRYLILYIIFVSSTIYYAIFLNFTNVLIQDCLKLFPFYENTTTY